MATINPNDLRDPTEGLIAVDAALQDALKQLMAVNLAMIHLCEEKGIFTSKEIDDLQPKMLEMVEEALRQQEEGKA